MSGTRKIIHIDMDAFYAAVEQRDHPAYQGQPVIVGGSPDHRGVVATASYEARRFGIHSAMPAAQARRLCPQGVFLRPRFEVYRSVSREIHALFRRYTPRVEPLSLDEAYLDVSDSALHRGSATLIARDIKARIHETTGLTASAGVSYNKFLAKLASDLDKPDGLHLITPEQGPDFVAALPIGRFHGIGRAIEARMHALGIRTGADLRAAPPERLQAIFGKLGGYYHALARGIDERPVESHRERKSLGSETTFDTDLAEVGEMGRWLERLAAEVVDGLQARQLSARTVTVKVRYRDFELVTRSRTLARPLTTLAEIRPLLPLLLGRTEAGERRVRLLGVTLSGLAPVSELPTAEQLDLF